MRQNERIDKIFQNRQNQKYLVINALFCCIGFTLPNVI